MNLSMTVGRPMAGTRRGQPTARGTFSGSFNYEFRMQARRPAVWGLVLGAGLLLAAVYLVPSPGDPAGVVVAERTQVFNLFLPVIYAILLADRWPRERRLNTRELLDSFPMDRGAWLWGKYLGAVLALTLPALVVELLEMAFIALTRGDWSLIPLALPAFALIVGPTLLFVGAFSVVCAELMPITLYIVLFVGYWFWANLVSPAHLPTLNCTLLTPSGLFARVSLLGGGMPPGCSGLAISAAQAWVNIGLLIGSAIMVLVAAQAIISWRTVRQ
jgi:ABC-2 type transport system permease protein